MYLGRVIGCVWATAKSPQLEGIRMLVIQPVTPELKDSGKPIVCTDWTGAGAGEVIYWVRSKEASFPFLPQEPPTDATVIGIVDSVHLEPRAATDSAAHGTAPARQKTRRSNRKAAPKEGQC